MARPTLATSFMLMALVLLDGAAIAFAQPTIDYLAPIPAPPGSQACIDTAVDCSDICDQHQGLDSACNLQTPIGEYLR